MTEFDSAWRREFSILAWCLSYQKLDDTKNRIPKHIGEQSARQILQVYRGKVIDVEDT